MKVLLFGAGGQLGRELKAQLTQQGIEVRAHGRNTVDLTQWQQVTAAFDEFKPDVVINAAADTAVDQAESEPDEARAINAQAPELLSVVCQTHRAFLIHYSTDYVFDGTKNIPYSELDAPKPLNVYGQTKLEGEQRIRGGGVDHLILRIGWVYSATGKNFFNTVLRLAREGKPLRIVNDQIGVPTSTVAVARLTGSIVAAKARPHGLFHFAPAGQTSWFWFARSIVEKMKLGVEVVPIPTSDYPTAARRPAYSVMSAAALQKAFPFPQRSWEELLDEVVATARER